jgi:hypothetical protein
MPRSIEVGGGSGRFARAAVGLVVAVMVASCAGGPSPSASTAGSAGSPAATAPSSADAASSASVPASPVVGVVIKVDSAGLDKVSGFRLRTNDGQTLALSIGVLENGAEFPPGHLAEHLATAQPVKVWFRDQDGALLVYRIEDAG